MPQSRIANGDIYPCRFVKLTTTDGRAVQCGAGDRGIGISQKDTRRSEYIDSSGKAAASGEPLMIYDLGEECALEIAGTVAQGDRLKADTDGKGVVASTDKDQYIAVALTQGVSGEIIIAKVQPGEVSV